MSITPGIKHFLRWLAPAGIVGAHRRRFRMSRLGLPGCKQLAEAVETCRYELWPDFLRRREEPWTLVDVGANEGDFLSAVGQLAELKSVFAYEPLPVCHSSLEKRLQNMKSGHLFQAAVGASAGELIINFTGDSKMSSALKPKSEVSAAYQAHDFEIKEKLTVSVVTLDETLPADAEIGLLKVDVQGFEMEVFRGAEQTLARSRAVLLEVNYVQHYEGGATFDVMFEFLRERGFRIHGISAPYGGGPEGPLWADAMFVKQQ